VSTLDRVFWTEGQYLEAADFLHQDRAHARMVRERVRDVAAHPWGLAHLVVDQDRLTAGEVRILYARGVFEDGTPFLVDAASPGDGLPAPLRIRREDAGRTLLLILPREDESRPADDDGPFARYRRVPADRRPSPGTPVTTPDELSGSDRMRLNLQLIRDSDPHHHCEVLPVGQVLGVAGDQAVSLDRRFLGPCLNVAAMDGFVTIAEGVRHGLHMRTRDLAERLRRVSRVAMPAVDVLALSALNGGLARLRHLLREDGRHSHPERLYDLLLELLGQLSSLGDPPASAPDPGALRYDHRNPRPAFDWLLDRLRPYLTASGGGAVQIPLSDIDGVRHAREIDSDLLRNARLILVAQSELQLEQLKQSFPSLSKIAAGSEIDRAVRSNLSGIPVRLLYEPPRELLMRGDCAYFELDRSQSAAWDAVLRDRSLAIHLTDQIPGPRLELWAIPSI
jgi:type VI secretion system protein ImpJ